MCNRRRWHSWLSDWPCEGRSLSCNWQHEGRTAISNNWDKGIHTKAEAVKAGNIENRQWPKSHPGQAEQISSAPIKPHRTERKNILDKRPETEFSPHPPGAVVRNKHRPQRVDRTRAQQAAKVAGRAETRRCCERGQRGQRETYTEGAQQAEEVRVSVEMRGGSRKTGFRWSKTGTARCHAAQERQSAADKDPEQRSGLTARDHVELIESSVATAVRPVHIAIHLQTK
jgi:hypothetical protein